MLQLNSFPCHTQAVERGIKLVTEACAAVCEPQHDGFICAQIASRSAMKVKIIKTHYKILIETLQQLSVFLFTQYNIFSHRSVAIRHEEITGKRTFAGLCQRRSSAGSESF